MPYVSTNDGVRLFYTTRGAANEVSPIVLVHGWSGSHRYFENSIDLLAEKAGGTMIVAFDLRFHGDSDKPEHGFHVARLAADLRDVLTALKLTTPTVVGTSLGCAIIWSYIELYGEEGLGKCVFVDQAPSQWRCPIGSTAVRVSTIQRASRYSERRQGYAVFRQGQRCCLTKPLQASFSAS